MGVVMWEMYTREAPYNELTAQQIIAALMMGKITLPLPAACEPEASRCLPGVNEHQTSTYVLPGTKHSLIGTYVLLSWIIFTALTH
jgi:hypothetical protein